MNPELQRKFDTMMNKLAKATGNPVMNIGYAVAAPTEAEEELVQIDDALCKLRWQFDRVTLQEKTGYVFFPLFF